MTQQKFMVLLVVAALTAGLELSAPHAAIAGSSGTALGDPHPSPVTSIKVSGGKIIAVAEGKSLSFDGVYKNAKGGWVQFDDGNAVAILGEDGRKAAIQETKIERGAVVFVTGSGEIVLGNGVYEKQNPTQPRGPQPQPRPNPNAFEIREGEIETVWIGGSG